MALKQYNSIDGKVVTSHNECSKLFTSYYN